MRPGSGSWSRARGLDWETLWAYGLPALPSSGFTTLSPEPSADRQAYWLPTLVSGGWGRESFCRRGSIWGRNHEPTQRTYTKRQRSGRERSFTGRDSEDVHISTVECSNLVASFPLGRPESKTRTCSKGNVCQSTITFALGWTTDELLDDFVSVGVGIFLEGRVRREVGARPGSYRAPF